VIEKFEPKTKFGKKAEDAMIMGKPAPKQTEDDMEAEADMNEDGAADMAEPTDDAYDDEAELEGEKTPEMCVEKALASAGVADPATVAATVVEALREEGLLL